jgi:hypothetical protein
MARLANRVARLEHRAQCAAFDPRRICRLAGQCYETGAPLPATSTYQERALAKVFLDALVTTGMDWFCHPDPLPLKAPPR